MKHKIGRNDNCPCGSKLKFKKCCLNKESMSLEALIFKHWENIVGTFKDKEREKVGLSVHLFRDNWIRLKMRKEESVQATVEIRDANPKTDNTQLIQLKLVDKIEAFHQQVYTALASLIRVIQFLGINGDKDQIPFNSIEKFLLHIKDIKYKDDADIGDIIDKLLYSRDYRAKFIDHPQQNKMHNWASYTYPNSKGEIKCVVIYYPLYGSVPVYGPDIDATIENFDPHSLKFTPFIGRGVERYVSPDIEDTFSAFELLVKKIFNIKN